MHSSVMHASTHTQRSPSSTRRYWKNNAVHIIYILILTVHTYMLAVCTIYPRPTVRSAPFPPNLVPATRSSVGPMRHACTLGPALAQPSTNCIGRPHVSAVVHSVATTCNHDSTAWITRPTDRPTLNARRPRVSSLKTEWYRPTMYRRSLASFYCVSLHFVSRFILLCLAVFPLH